MISFNKTLIQEREEAQFPMRVIAMEECNELARAISKLIRFPNGSSIKSRDELVDDLTEEMADVLIVIEALKLYYGITDEQVQRWVDFKENRAWERVQSRKDHPYIIPKVNP